MHKNILWRVIFMGLVAFTTIMLLTSCNPEPNPLVGAWADNRGDTITLMADNTFLSDITNEYGQKVTTEGTYSVLLNVITFTTKAGHQRVSEWDIRGNILYITWTDDSGNTLPLSLYKIRN